jgi:hypothetical protein
LPYAILNFISSACFGISESISIPVLQKLNIDAYGSVGIISRTLFLGLLETSLIIYFDLKTIAQQKSEFLIHKPSLLSIALPSLFRNTVIWAGTTVSIFIIYHFEHSFGLHLAFQWKTLLSFILGIIFALLALPFDIVCTQAVGAEFKMSIWQRIKCNIQSEGLACICRGGLMRVIALGIFTAATVLTDLFLNQ